MRESYTLEFKADALVILRYLEGNVEQAAELLDIAPALLREWMHEFNIWAEEPAPLV